MRNQNYRVKVIRNRLIGKGERGYYNHILKIKAVADTRIFIGSGAINLQINKDLFAKADFDDLKELGESIEFLERDLPYNGSTFYIPGSSVKGAVRHRAEMMFKSVDGSVPSCYIVYDRAIAPLEKYKRIYGEQVLEERGKCIVDMGRGREAKVCEVCDIFGAPGAIAKIAFSDLIPKSDDPVEVVKINGVTYRVFKKGTVFNGKILIGDLELYQIGLLLKALRHDVDKPILIGMFKYKGWSEENKFGRLKIKVTDIKPRDLNLDLTLNKFDEVLGKYYRYDLDETNF